MRRKGFKAGLVLAFLPVVLTATPALAQWYDTTEVPGGVGDIIQPFTLKAHNLSTGAGLSTWIAPGTEPEVTAISLLLRGGYAFSDTPIYLGLEVPMSYYTSESFSSGFAIGNVGLGVKYRLDPFEESLEIYTGWSLDLLLPTAWVPDDADDAMKHLLAQSFGRSNSLMAGMHIPEIFGIVATFDVVVPGKIVYFQFEIAPAIFIPVSDTDERETGGAFIWGAAAGIHIIPEIAFLLEFKGNTPINMEDLDTFIAISPGFRFDFGLFKPGLWVSIPLTSQYRDIHPDVIIGLDLSFAF